MIPPDFERKVRSKTMLKMFKKVFKKQAAKVFTEYRQEG